MKGHSLYLPHHSVLFLKQYTQTLLLTLCFALPHRVLMDNLVLKVNLVMLVLKVMLVLQALLDPLVLLDLL